MSLILKGIDMPKYCKAVEVKFYISDIDVYRYTCTELHREVSAVFSGEALDNIIQIPKGHGRLIDADKYQYFGDLEYEPTILESEEDK